jgi:hypothetical protein
MSTRSDLPRFLTMDALDPGEAGAQLYIMNLVPLWNLGGYELFLLR